MKKNVDLHFAKYVDFPASKEMRKIIVQDFYFKNLHFAFSYDMTMDFGSPRTRFPAIPPAVRNYLQSTGFGIR